MAAGANALDTRLMDQTIQAIIMDRPKPTKKKAKNYLALIQFACVML